MPKEFNEYDDEEDEEYSLDDKETTDEEDKESVYSEEGREEMEDDDEIDPVEEGFMEGAVGRGKKNCCAECGKLLSNKEDIFEREFEGEVKWFCSEEHAEKYAKKLKQKNKKKKK